MPTSLRYDANDLPGAAWRAATREQRCEAVVRHHRELGGRHAAHVQLQVHARLHVTVEDQLASGVAAVGAFFERFAGAGVVRHEIVHAASATFAEAMRAAMADGATDAAQLYAQRLAALQPAQWLARAVPARL